MRVIMYFVYTTVITRKNFAFGRFASMSKKGGGLRRKGLIYVVSTYYHAYISCVKQLVNRCNADILVTGYIPESDILAQRLRESGLFGAVYRADNPCEYVPRNRADKALHLHKRNAQMIEPFLPVDFRGYETVCIYHDDTWVAHYLKNRRIPYRLIEDGLDSLKHIKDTSFAYMARGGFVPFVKRIFRIGYVFNGSDPLTTAVEVNDRNGVCVSRCAKKKLVEVSRKELFSRLTESDAEVLKRVFSRDVPEIDPTRTVLMITQPFCVDDPTISPDEQISLYRLLAGEELENGDALVIKPHPRDIIDYSAVFPHAVILNKNIPAEMLVYYNIGSDIKKMIGFNSTALNTLRAKQYRRAEPQEYLKKIRRKNND